MSQVRIIFFGLAVIYLLGVIVQFFLAGLGAFGASDYDPHAAFGFFLAIGSVVLLVLALVGRLSRFLIALAVALVVLNILQIVLASIDVERIAALHPVNAIAIFLVAYELVQRSRRYLAAKIDAPG